MRAAAEVDEIALAVERDRLAGRDRRDDLGLVNLPLLAEELDRAVAIPNLALDRLVPRNDLVHPLLDLLEVLRREGLTPSEVVVEAVFDRGADRHLRLGVELLDGFGHHVRSVVAQQLEAVGRRARDDLDARVAVDRPREVAELAVDADGYRVALESRADRERDGAAVDGIGESPGGPVG